MNPLAISAAAAMKSVVSSRDISQSPRIDATKVVRLFYLHQRGTQNLGE
jgi:hypothetical protein